MTLIPRPRLWLAALFAALSLMVFVTLQARRSDAQDKAVEKPAVLQSQPDKVADSTAEAVPEMQILDLNNGNVIVRIPVTAKMLRSPGIRHDSLVDVYYERLGELEPETERINKLLTDIKVESLSVAPGAKAGSPPRTIGLILKRKQANTLKMALDSKQCDVFLKLAESSAKEPLAVDSGFDPLAPTPRRSVFIEIPLDEESEAIHKLVDKLIKAGSVKRLPLDATQTTRIDYTAVIAARADLKFERVGQLVDTLTALGVGKVQFGQAAGDTNSVRVTAPAHVTPQILQNIRTELAKYDDFEADVLVARGIRGPKGHLAVPISKRTAEIEKALKNCDIVTITIGSRNLLLSIFENTDKPQLANKIFEATKSNADIELFVLGDHLLINTPQKDFDQPDVQDGGKIAQAVIAALMGGADDAQPPIPGAGIGGNFGGGGPAAGSGFGGVASPGGGLGAGGFAGFRPANSSNTSMLPQSTIMFPNDVVAIPKDAIGSQQLVQGGNLAIIASNKHDMLWGYSEPLGKWFKQPVSLDVEGLIPYIGGQVAAVTPAYKTKPDEKTYFAFSSATGRWSTLEVSLNASEPIVHATMVVVTDGETTHVFKNDTGKWSTPTALVADNERSSATTPKPTAKSHPSEPTAEEPNGHGRGLRYLSYADDLEVYLVDLDADGVLDVVPIDETKSSRPNENQSVSGAWGMVREVARRRREVAEEQAALQESLGPQHPAMVKINARLAELEAEERDWIARLKAFAAPASFGRVTVIDWQSRLKSDLQQAERGAEQAAREVKSPKNSRDKDQAQIRLRESVGKAFASRQKLQQLEAELLRERLRQVDDRLEERGRLRDRIIQRRVEELTNSNLDWGASEPLDLSKVDESQPLTRIPQTPNSDPRANLPLAPETAETFHGVLYFEAAWCGPCQKLNPILSKLEREGLTFRRVDTDKDRHLVQQFHVTAIPTFIRCFEGREVQRIEGMVAEDRIRGMILGARYRTIPTQTVPPTRILPPPQSRSKGNFHLLGEASASGTSVVPVFPPTSHQDPRDPTEPTTIDAFDDVSIALAYTIYEANETALKELGLVPKTNEEITGDNKLSGTTTVTDTAKIAMLPELLKREDLKLLTRGRGTSVNKLNAPLPLVGASKDATHGLELLAQATVVKNGRVHFSVKVGQPKSDDLPVELESVLFETDLLLNSTGPSLVGPFKKPGENNPWLIASFVAEVVLPRTATPGLQPLTVVPDEPTSEYKPFDPTSSGWDAPNTTPESRAVRNGRPAEAVVIVNGEFLTYRDLVRWGISLKDVSEAVNLILLKHAAKQAKLDIGRREVDTEVQQLASKFEVSIDQWYSMLEKERGISREHYREFVIWPMLALKRLVGDDEKQQLTFLAGLRAAAKIELVDPDAKLRPVSTEATEPAQDETVLSTEPPPAEKNQPPESLEDVSKM